MNRTAMALAGAAALTIGTTAHAAPTINYVNAGNGDFTATFGNSPKNASKTFDDTFTSFTVNTMGTLSGSLITIGFAPSTDLDFSFADVTGAMKTIPFVITKTAAGGNPDGVETGVMGPVNIGPGTYSVHVVGSNFGAAANSSYSGTLNFTAAPEPAAWALMIAGFGAIGFAMRRQRATYRVAYS